MALRNIDLYEALKKDLSEEAAKMIAEVVPAADDLATKLDIADLRAEMHQEFSRMRGWMFAGLLTMTFGFLGTMAAVVAVLAQV